MASEVWKARARAQRYGCCLQGVAAPSLFEAGTGRLTAPIHPAQFEEVRRAMTVPNPKGRVVKPTKKELAST